METKIFCSECGSELDEGSVFCAECGVPVADGSVDYVDINGVNTAYCTECGSPVDDNMWFCTECGVRFEGHAESSSRSSFPRLDTKKSIGERPTQVSSEGNFSGADDNLRPVILNRDARKHFTSGSNELEKHEFTLISRGLFSIDRINVTSANVDGDLNDKISRERLVSGKLPGWDPLPPDSLVVNRQKS